MSMMWLRKKGICTTSEVSKQSLVLTMSLDMTASNFDMFKPLKSKRQNFCPQIFEKNVLSELDCIENSNVSGQTV